LGFDQRLVNKTAILNMRICAAKAQLWGYQKLILHGLEGFSPCFDPIPASPKFPRPGTLGEEKHSLG
jgi:hypothetical protein